MSDTAMITSTTGTNATDAAASSQRAAKTGATSGIGSMNFDDFLDMVNPLEHIPLVSSIYRAVTGDTINPLSRIAGDALYGGVFGLASAGISALGALGDEIYTASTGKSASETIVAALFGNDSDAGDGDVQLASATTPTDPSASATSGATSILAGATALSTDASLSHVSQTALLQTPANQSPILVMPDFVAHASTSATASASPPSSTMAEAATMPAMNASGLPLDRSKQAYGGVMDTAMMQNALQNQSLALALASGQDHLQADHALRNNRFATAGASPMTAPTAQSASLSLPGSATTASMSNSTNAALAPAQNIASAQAQASAQTAAQAGGQTGGQSLSTNLRQSIPQSTAELKAIKGLSQYRSTALRTPVMGSSVDISN